VIILNFIYVFLMKEFFSKKYTFFYKRFCGNQHRWKIKLTQNREKEKKGEKGGDEK